MSRSLRWLPLMTLAAPVAAHAALPERPFSLEGFVGSSAVGQHFGRDLGFGGGLALRVTRNYQVRADVDSFSWQRAGSLSEAGTVLYYTEELRNVALFAGARRSFGRSKFRPYVELGVGRHWLEFEKSFGDGASRPETEGKLGAALGFGIEGDCDGHVCVGFSVRYRAMGTGVGARDDVPTRSWRVGATVLVR